MSVMLFFHGITAMNTSLVRSEAQEQTTSARLHSANESAAVKRRVPFESEQTKRPRTGSERPLTEPSDRSTDIRTAAQTLLGLADFAEQVVPQKINNQAQSMQVQKAQTTVPSPKNGQRSSGGLALSPRAQTNAVPSTPASQPVQAVSSTNVSSEVSKIHKDLFKAARKGTLKDVQDIIHQGTLHTVLGDKGQTVLHEAAFNNRLEIVQWLATHYWDLAAKKDMTGRTALQVAVRRGYFEIAKFLAEQFPHILRERELHGWTALHEATISGDIKMAQWLMTNDPQLQKLRTNDGWTVLHTAASKGGKLEIVQYIARNCIPFLIDIKNNKGQTCVDIARSNNNNDIAQWLTATYPQLASKKSNPGLSTAVTNQADQPAVADKQTKTVKAVSTASTSSAVTRQSGVKRTLSSTDELHKVAPKDTQQTGHDKDKTARTSPAQHNAVQAGTSLPLSAQNTVTSQSRQKADPAQPTVQNASNVPTPVWPFPPTQTVSLRTEQVKKGSAAKKNQMSTQVVQTGTSQNSTVSPDQIPTPPVQTVSASPRTVHEELLFTAAQKGNLSDLQRILKDGAPHTAVDEKQQTILHIATAHNHTQVVQWLLSKYPDLKDRLSVDGTALHTAVMHGHFDLLKWFEQHCPELFHKLSPMSASVLHTAVLKERLDIAQYLARNYPQLVRSLASNNLTVLHTATLGKNPDMVKWLIEEYPDLKILVTAQGATILHTGAIRKGRRIIDYLVQECPSLLYVEDNEGHTCLHAAVLKGKPSVASWLATNYPRLLTIKNKAHKTPLEEAIGNNKQDMVAALCQQGAPQLSNVQPAQQPSANAATSSAATQTAAKAATNVPHHTVQPSSVPGMMLVQSLYQFQQQPVRTSAVVGTQAVSQPVVRPSLVPSGTLDPQLQQQVVRSFASQPATTWPWYMPMIQMPQSQQQPVRTSAVVATQTPFRPIISTFTYMPKPNSAPVQMSQLPAQPIKSTIASTARTQTPATSVPVENVSSQTMKATPAQTASVTIHKPEWVDFIDVNKHIGGKTVLHHGLLQGSAVVLKLLALGADINAQDGEGKTVLMQAVENKNEELIQLLLSKNANVNMQNNVGETALIIAAKGGSLSLVTLLIGKGADTAMRDKRGNMYITYLDPSIQGLVIAILAQRS